MLAQEKPGMDSLSRIEKEIRDHPETEMALLGKSRAVLLESLKSGDIGKARNVLVYMRHRFDSSRVVVLYPFEQIRVSYLLMDYEPIFGFARESNFDNTQYGQKMTPQRDLLALELPDLFQGNAGDVVSNIQKADLPLHKRDFLLLFQKAIAGPDRDDPLVKENFQQAVNAESDLYLSTYPESEFNPFVRRYIRFVMKVSEWGFGYGIALGYLGLPGDLGRHLKDYVLLSMVFEGSYRQVYACLGVDIGAAHHLQTGFLYNGTWKDNLLVMHTGAYLAGGPILTLGGNLTVIPHTGIGYMDFSPPHDEAIKEGNDVSLHCAAWLIGAHVKFPLGGEDSNTHIWFSASYRTALTSIEIARGGYTFLTVGVDLFGGTKHREM